MNERMTELYKEACEFAYGVCKKEGRPGGTSDHIWHTLSTGRFAELIVRECMSTINPKTGTKWIKDQTQEEFWKNQSVHLIKEHFGVEE